MHCKPETTFISARFAHEQSIARTSDFPVDFISLWGLGFGVVFLAWFGLVYYGLVVFVCMES